MWPVSWVAIVSPLDRERCEADTQAARFKLKYAARRHQTKGTWNAADRGWLRPHGDDVAQGRAGGAWSGAVLPHDRPDHGGGQGARPAVLDQDRERRSGGLERGLRTLAVDRGLAGLLALGGADRGLPGGARAAQRARLRRLVQELREHHPRGQGGRHGRRARGGLEPRAAVSGAVGRDREADLAGRLPGTLQGQG